MHTILINKRRTHAQSNYTNTKLKAWFRRLLQQNYQHEQISQHLAV